MAKDGYAGFHGGDSGVTEGMMERIWTCQMLMTKEAQ